LNPFEIVAIRLLLATPVLFLIMKLKRVKMRFEKHDAVIIITASLILGLHFLIQAFGLIYTTATNTAWLIATIPVFTAVAAVVFLKESIGRRQWVGILIATAGVLLLISKGGFGSLAWLNSVGDWLILVSCLSWTVYTVITRNITRRYNPLPLTTAFMTIPAVLLLFYLIAVTSFDKLSGLPVSIWLWLIFLGVFNLALAHWLWLEGLAKKGAAGTGVFLYFEPVVTTVAAAAILGEKFTLIMLLATILIIVGVSRVQRK
jgi:RarD protein